MKNFTKLNAPLDTQHDAEIGQGMGSNLNVRNLFAKRISTPDVVRKVNNEGKESLYQSILTPSDIQVSRVVVQVTKSEDNVPISTQLNNKLNPSMDNSSVNGGTRSKA